MILSLAAWLGAGVELAVKVALCQPLSANTATATYLVKNDWLPTKRIAETHSKCDHFGLAVSGDSSK